MHFTLRQLALFASVATHSSFSRAAEAMHLTQPAVSAQIRNLEQHVGLPLFEYVNKQVRLTDAGRELYTATQTIFESVERFEMAISEMKGLRKGRLRISVTSTTKYFVPRLLGPFCQQYPGIDVSLNVTNRQRLLERIADQSDDLYIMGVPPDHLELEVVPFLENRIVVLAPRDHPLTREEGPISLERLAQEPWLLREIGSGTRATVEKFLAEKGISPRVRMELGSSETIKQAVAGGMGVAVVSEHALVLDRADAPFVTLDVEGFPIRRHWYFVYSKNKPMSAVAKAFLDYVLADGRRIVEDVLAHAPSRFNPLGRGEAEILEPAEMGEPGAS